MAAQIAFTVIGLPAPQGSKRHVGRGILVESSKAVKPWREAVKAAAREQMVLRGLSAPAVPGAVEIWITWFLPRPKKYANKPLALPRSRPDLSKLLRATEDAMTDAGVWEDDACVVGAQVYKRYVGHGSLMDVPGAEIQVMRFGMETAHA